MQTQDTVHEIAECAPSNIDGFFELVAAQLAAAEAAKSGHHSPVESIRCAQEPIVQPQLARIV